VEPTHLGVGWSCSHALDCLDESMLMTISSSSSGTLVLVPDRRRLRRWWATAWAQSPPEPGCMRTKASEGKRGGTRQWSPRVSDVGKERGRGRGILGNMKIDWSVGGSNSIKSVQSGLFQRMKEFQIDDSK